MYLLKTLIDGGFRVDIINQHEILCLPDNFIMEGGDAPDHAYTA